MLLDKLTAYMSEDIYPMHMPGHKRSASLPGALPYALDITEIPGFDNLMDPRGVLRDVGELAARLYGSGSAFPLVGGSTCGILAAITACVPRGGKIIMQRGCHMSVYNAACLGELETAYILPRADDFSGVLGSVTPEDVEAALVENLDAALVVITSPTYEGVVSDVASIAEAAHRRGIPVLVDSAHGAHLGFSQDFPDGAVCAGADIVVMSLHKTLPALTQCALLHVSGDIVDADEVARCVRMLQTSSPSYILLASIDHCLRLIERDGARLFDDYSQRLRRFGADVTGLRKLRILGAQPEFSAFDNGKIVVSAAGCDLSGPEMARLMCEQYRVEPELAYTDYIVAMTSIMDSGEGFRRLADALIGLDDIAKPSGAAYPRRLIELPNRADTIAGALKRKGGALIPTRQAAGLMSLEYVWAYPPGVPIIVPGEIIGEGELAAIEALADSGVALMSTRGGAPGHILAQNV